MTGYGLIGPRPDPMTAFWRAQEDDLIGGWCITFPDSDPRTPAEGALSVADFCRQEDAEHIAKIHNQWLTTERMV